MATEMDLQTIDDGSVYLARKGGDPDSFVLAVRDRGEREAEVRLTPGDLLRIVRDGSQLLIEMEG